MTARLSEWFGRAGHPRRLINRSMPLTSRLVFFGIFIVVALAKPYPAAAQPVSSSHPGLESLQLSVSEFQASWQRAWRDSEEYRRWRMSAQDFARRHVVLHCHKESFDEGFRRRWNLKSPAPEPYQVSIDKSVAGHRWCPRWMVAPNLDEAGDESVWIDNALRPSLRAGVAAKRARLVGALDSAYALATEDSWLAGQVVRFHLDALDPSGAEGAAARCRADAWWCSALSGLVQAKRGNVRAADSIFAVMRSTMADSERCEWDDIAQLLPEPAQSDFARTACSERAMFTRRIWWLADPMWRASGNARRVEHDVRQTEIRLRLATMQDERLALDSARGGVSVARMIRRYGWPSYRAWLGTAEDRSHVGYVAGELSGVPAPPFTTFEYALDRIHTFPTWRAVLNPFGATPSDWHLIDEDSTGTPTSTWWPTEHFRPVRRLVELPEGQTVSVRRQSYIEVVSAIVLGHPAMKRRVGRYDVMLVASSGSERVDSLDQQWGAGGDTLRLRGRLSAEPTLLAIEAMGMSPTGLDARTRFGFVPPAPLSALAVDEPAVSDLALLPALDDSALATPSDNLLARLRPTRELPANDRRVSVYWESYNTRPSDSAQIVLRVVPEERAGQLRRLGIAARLMSDPSEGVELRWRDFEPLGGQSTLDGPVPAQMRAVTLDLRHLKPGRYFIELSMQRRDGRTAATQTTVELLP